MSSLSLGLGWLIAILLYIPFQSPVASSGQKAGWETLFDGKSTRGWHTYGQNPGSTPWKAESGTLHLPPFSERTQRADLVSDKAYGNFHLKLEWKIAQGSNSGIVFYVMEDTAKYRLPINTGLEMQVLDNDNHSDGKIYNTRNGDLYDLIASSKDASKPPGQWNEVEIKALNGRLHLMLNGITVVSTTMWDENWNKMVSGSKFATMPGFGIYKTGKIALQDHKNEVWYRNIRIKAL